MRLRWIKVNAGIWVDCCGFYCIRRRTGGYHDYEDFAGRDIYEARETYPGLPVELVAIDTDLRRAKRACQAHYDGTGIEEAA